MTLDKAVDWKRMTIRTPCRASSFSPLEESAARAAGYPNAEQGATRTILYPLRSNQCRECKLSGDSKRGRTTDSKQSWLLTVSGVDVAGQPFTVTAHTFDFTRSTVRLDNIPAKVRCGDEVTIEYRGNRACFVIRWLGPLHSTVEGQLGLECLDTLANLWPEHLTLTAAT